MRRALAAALAGAVLLVGASPALASSVSAPETISEHGKFLLAGVIEEPPGPPSPSGQPPPTGVAELRLTGPGADAVPVARAARPTPSAPRSDPTRVEFALRTAPCNLPGGTCEGGRVLRNGTWTVQLLEVDRPADGEDVERATATVVVDVAALPPQDVTASLEGRTATVRWARGVGPERALVEPDVRWVVSDGKGLATTVGPEACDDGRCTASLVFPDSESGSRTLSVAASRPGSSSPTVTRAPEEVVVPAVPGAKTGAGASAGPDGSPVPGGGSGQATARSLGQKGLGGFAPGVGLPRLPGLPSPRPDPSVAVPQVADTFAPELDYGDREVFEPQAAPPAGGRGGVLTATSGGLLGDEQVMRSIAGALVLLMSGAHLRAWLAAGHADS